jgi:hypothetical protein
MTDSDDKNFQRYGRRNQKEQLSRPESVFPPDTDTELDLDSLSLPDTDSEALQSLTSLADEVKAPRITPSTERFPPLAPSNQDESEPETVESEPAKKQVANNTLYNVLTIFFILATFVFIAWAATIWNNPQSVLNPFPPATPYLVVTATPGASMIGITATPDESGQIFVVITDTPVVSAPVSAYPFVTQVSYIANTNDFACDWSSIAGTVSDNVGNGLDGYRIRVIGTNINETIFSGTSPNFGAGGFEFPLLGAAQTATFTVQLFSPQNTELSEAINISTRTECDANVTFLNFVGNP